MAITFRGGQDAMLGFEAETVTPPLFTSTSYTSFTPNICAGYYDGPGIESNESPGLLPGLALYQGAQILPGRREHTLRANLRVGNVDVLRCGVRSSNLTPSGVLPFMAFAGGAQGLFTLAPFSWVARYSLVKEITLQFQEGEPVTASVEVWPLFLDRAGTGLDVTEANMDSAGGTVLMWQDASITINGSAQRRRLRSATVRITNDLERVGMRRDYGDDNPLSRTPYWIESRGESVGVDFSLYDKLPDGLVDATGQATNWQAIEMSATRAVAGGGTHTVRVRVEQNRMARYGLQPTAPNALMQFGAASLGRVVTITAS